MALQGAKRLQRELQSAARERMNNPNQVVEFWAAPKETDILIWHYVLVGPEATPYAGGYYHGVLIFPPEYPLKPPQVKMLTPSGRFEVNTRLCLSMSDFHPGECTFFPSLPPGATGLFLPSHPYVGPG